MVRRSFVIAAAAALAVLLSASSVGAAVRPFAPAQTVVGGCAASEGDSVTSAGGTLVGYATCQNGAIRYFSRNADGTLDPSEATGFSGRVLGVAYDDTGSYVLFATNVDIRIGRRTNAGAYSSRVVDTGVGGGTRPFGDVIARDGQWFGVWSMQVGPGGEFAQSELFFGGSTRPTQRVTNTPGNVDDLAPTLAYSGSVPVLLWARIVDPFDTSTSDIYKSKFVAGAWEAPQPFATAGSFNFAPDMAIAGGRTFVTWQRDGFVWVAGNANPNGAFSSRMFNTGGFEPEVAASTTSGFVDHVFVSWTAFGVSFDQDRVFFAESATNGSVHSTWDGTYVSGVGAFGLGVGGHATKGSVAYTYNGGGGVPGGVVVRAQS